MVDLKFKVGDRWRTRDGSTVEIVAVVPRLQQPIIGVLDGCTACDTWTADGKLFAWEDHALDLVSELEEGWP